MSKVNYNEISRRSQSKGNTESAKTVYQETKVPESNDQKDPEVLTTTVTPDAKAEPEVTKKESIVKGTVVNCVKLNIRKAPDASSQVLCVVDANTEVSIDLDDSTGAWYNVYVDDSILGYCMKNYIAVKN